MHTKKVFLFFWNYAFASFSCEESITGPKPLLLSKQTAHRYEQQKTLNQQCTEAEHKCNQTARLFFGFHSTFLFYSSSMKGIKILLQD